MARSLNTDERLRLGPYVTRVLYFRLGVLVFVHIDQQDISARFEQVVKLRRGDMRHREIGFHLRQTVHVRTHRGTDRLFLRRFADNQTLIDTSGRGSEQSFALRATNHNKR